MSFWALLFFLSYAKGTNVCSNHALMMERNEGIPEKLLHTISLVEAGRTNAKGELEAHPWAVNVGGKSHYFPTKDAAIRAVQKYQKQGIRNIDVGCAQINLQAHPTAFKSLHEAFDPQKNLSYAAKFLKRLKNAHNSWQIAVAHYHSATPMYHIPYRKKVLSLWDKEKKVDLASVQEILPRATALRPSLRPRIIHLQGVKRLHKPTIIRASSHTSSTPRLHVRKYIPRHR